MSRKSKIYDEDSVNTIIEAIENGNFVRVACESIGITKKTYYNWMRRGEEEQENNTIHGDFYNKVKQAEAIAETTAIAFIHAASKSDWRAAAWWLSKKYPERWGEKKEAIAEAKEVKIIDDIIAEEEASDQK